MASVKKIRGINLVYDDIGQGEVLVFVHGQPLDRTMWQYQVEEFSQTNRLIIPDLRGYGQSDIPEKATLLDELALDIIYLLEELGIKTVVFVGLSMGGQILLDIFRLAPALFKGLVLADTDARAETGPGYANRIKLAEKILADGMQKFTDERIEMFLCKNTFEKNPRVAGHLKKMMYETSAQGSAMVQRGRAERRDHTSALSLITFPALIIVGEEDEFTPVSAAEYMRNKISHAKLEIITSAGHIPNMEQPDQFNRLLKKYLTELSACLNLYQILPQVQD